jgi:hypothetical protein
MCIISNIMNIVRGVSYEGCIFTAQAPATGSREIGSGEADFGGKN